MEHLEAKSLADVRAMDTGDISILTQEHLAWRRAQGLFSSFLIFSISFASLFLLLNTFFNPLLNHFCFGCPGELHCKDCGRFFLGQRGLQDHQRQKHGKAEKKEEDPGKKQVKISEKH